MYSFWGQHSSDFSSYIHAVTRWQEEYLLGPLVADLKPLIYRYRENFRVLQQTFLGYPPVVPSNRRDPFYSNSKHRDVDASARRYYLGLQSRGLHLSLREAVNKEQHVRRALMTPHPATQIDDTLDPLWRFCFAQFNVK